MAPDFAKVGELRALVGARLRVAVELGERHDRDVELLGQQLSDRLISATSCWRLSGRREAGAGHELQVVDDDQREALGCRCACAGPWRGCRRC